MGHPVRLRIGAGRVAAQRHDVADPGRGQPAHHVAQLGDRVVHRRQVRQRQHRGVGGDPLGHREGALAGRAAGPVGDRDERGRQPLQLAQRRPQLGLPGLVARREELEGPGGSGLVEQLAHGAGHTCTGYGVARPRARSRSRRVPFAGSGAYSTGDCRHPTNGSTSANSAAERAGGRRGGPGAAARGRQRGAGRLPRSRSAPCSSAMDPAAGPRHRRGGRGRRRRQAAAAGVRLLGLARGGHRARRGRRRGAARRRRAGVRARQRPGARRRHGRRDHPPRPAGHPHRLRRPAHRRRARGQSRAVRHRRGDPGRRPGPGVVRRAAAPLGHLRRGAGPGPAGVGQHAHRGHCRSVPRPAPRRRRPARARGRPEGGPLQERRLHRAAPAAPGGRRRRRRPGGDRRLHRHRAAAGRGLPAPRRRPRRVRRPRRHRQVRRRGPARGQADPARRADRDRHRRGRPRPAAQRARRPRRRRRRAGLRPGPHAQHRRAAAGRGPDRHPDHGCPRGHRRGPGARRGPRRAGRRWPSRPPAAPREDRPRAHRPRRRRRRRPRRPVRRPAAARRRPRGHRRRARPAARRPRRPGRAGRLRAGHRPVGAHRPRPDPGRAGLRRRRAGGPARAAPAGDHLPRAVRRRLDPRRARRPRGVRRRGRAGLRARRRRRGHRLPAAHPRPRPAAVGRVHRPQPGLPAGPGRPARCSSWPARAASAGSPRTWTSRLTDERLRRLFSFQALYAGVSPFTAIAAYAVIAELDIGKGVWHPVGGIHAVPAALAAAAADAGVVFRYDTAVASLDIRGGRAAGVRLADGELLPADAVVVTVDRPDTAGPPPRAVGSSRSTPPAAWPSTSACAGVRRPCAPHHQLRGVLAGGVHRADPRPAGR